MFKQFEKLDREDTDAMREMVDTACAELEMHAQIEGDVAKALNGQLNTFERKRFIDAGAGAQLQRSGERRQSIDGLGL